MLRMSGQNHRGSSRLARAATLAAASAVSLCTLAFASPAMAAESSSSSVTSSATAVTLENAASLLPASEKKKWNNLSKAKQQRVVQILNDPSFGTAAAVTKYDEVSVSTADGASNAAAASSLAASAAAATGSRSTYHRQYWTILGIRYTEITTTVDYQYSGSRVTKIDNCYGTVVNYVPVRSIDKSSYSDLSNGAATCKTRWTLSRPLQATVTGTEGLKVNGSGTVLQVWTV